MCREGVSCSAREMCAVRGYRVLLGGTVCSKRDASGNGRTFIIYCLSRSYREQTLSRSWL